MNIIKRDSRCHLYRTCPPFPSLKPRHLVADAFRVGNKGHNQASEQPNKLANLLTLKTAGQKALIAGYMRLYSLDEMIWLKSKAIKNSTTIRWLKIEKIDLLYTFFTIFVNSLSVFFFPISYKEKITEVTRNYGKRCEYCKTMLKYTGMLYLCEHVLLRY